MDHRVFAINDDSTGLTPVNPNACLVSYYAYIRLIYTASKWLRNDIFKKTAQLSICMKNINWQTFNQRPTIIKCAHSHLLKTLPCARFHTRTITLYYKKHFLATTLLARYWKISSPLQILKITNRSTRIKIKVYCRIQQIACATKPQSNKMMIKSTGLENKLNTI